MSHRGKPVTKQIREERRRMAEERNKEYNEKYPTPQAKLAALPPTGATRQRARLMALIAAEEAAKEAKRQVEKMKAQSKHNEVEVHSHATADELEVDPQELARKNKARLNDMKKKGKNQ